MEKPEAISTRGMRKETLEQICKECNGNIESICDTLHVSEIRCIALLIAFGLHPMPMREGTTRFADDDLFDMAKAEAGYPNRCLPKLDDMFVSSWAPEAWARIVACGDAIIKRTGSIYPPWEIK